MASELEQIPGIGTNMAEHLIKAGFSTIESLKGKDPQEIYLRDCAAQNSEVDRCALYAYRLAVHYADHDGALPPGKTNWWNWKD
ncbi:MAG: helix-hairpin-helix domain-containing protein [Coriobacteriia bacterium]|nr:helix-hairpin-helix domain-containing protein [Coriobacteriia bacterium]